MLQQAAVANPLEARQQGLMPQQAAVASPLAVAVTSVRPPEAMAPLEAQATAPQPGRSER